MKEATISLYQDIRRELENGDYPIKLRVYFHRAKLYDTGISMSKDEFKHAYLSPFPRGRYKRLQIKLKAIESKAIEALKRLKISRFTSLKDSSSKQDPVLTMYFTTSTNT